MFLKCFHYRDMSWVSCQLSLPGDLCSVCSDYSSLLFVVDGFPLPLGRHGFPGFLGRFGGIGEWSLRVFGTELGF